MNAVGYFLVIAATMMVLSRVLPGFHVSGWVSALFASVLLATLNTVLKPVLFVLTLPLTVLTLGLFLIVLNAMMLALTATLVPGFRIHGAVPLLLASIVLAAVGAAWKAASRD